MLVKGIDVGGDFLEDYIPTEKNSFGLWVTFSIGPSSEDGGSIYQLLVCTPSWLESKTTKGNIFWGRHMLVIDSFDAKLIKNSVDQLIVELANQFPNDNDDEIAEKIARYAHWEYEDYY